MSDTKQALPSAAAFVWSLCKGVAMKKVPENTLPEKVILFTLSQYVH